MEAGMMTPVVFYLYVVWHEISVVGLDPTHCEEVRDTIVVLASSAQPPHFVSGCEPTRRRFDPPDAALILPCPTTDRYPSSGRGKTEPSRRDSRSDRTPRRARPERPQPLDHHH